MCWPYSPDGVLLSAETVSGFRTGVATVALVCTHQKAAPWLQCLLAETSMRLEPSPRPQSPSFSSCPPSSFQRLTRCFLSQCLGNFPGGSVIKPVELIRAQIVISWVWTCFGISDQDLEELTAAVTTQLDLGSCGQDIISHFPLNHFLFVRYWLSCLG